MIKPYTEKDIKNDAKARLLVTGPHGCGKTTMVLTSSPRPICVMNCDGHDASEPAVRHGADHLEIYDVDSAATMFEVANIAIQGAKAKKFRTIVVDTLTILVNSVLTLEMRRRYPTQKDGTSYAQFRQTQLTALEMMQQLVNQNDAHVIIVAHWDNSGNELALEGKQLKSFVPARVSEMARMSYDPDRDPQRVLHVGPSPSGQSKSRRVDHYAEVPASIEALFSHLGIPFVEG